MGLPAGKVQALQLSFEGLLKLYKTDNEAFWERLKGITTPRESELASVVVDNMANAMKGVEVGLQELNKLGSGRAATGS